MSGEAGDAFHPSTQTTPLYDPQRTTTSAIPSSVFALTFPPRPADSCDRHCRTHLSGHLPDLRRTLLILHHRRHHLPIHLLTTMGKLIKNHWARLIVLTAAAYQIAASIHGCFWPKVFWDFLTKTLDPAVRPVPVLQLLNLLAGLCAGALEWPLPGLAGSALHRSIEARLVAYPLAALAALLLYQGTNAGLYYLIGVGVYFWAFAEGEVRSVHVLVRRG